MTHSLPVPTREQCENVKPLVSHLDGLVKLAAKASSYEGSRWRDDVAKTFSETAAALGLRVSADEPAARQPSDPARGKIIDKTDDWDNRHAVRQPQSDLVKRLREFNTANWPILAQAADRIEALEAAAAQPSQGGEFERVDFYRLAKAFDVTIEKVHAAVGFTGYLYRQLTVPRAPTQPSREAALVKALRLILPMAEAYAYRSPTGVNLGECREAKLALAAYTPAKPEEADFETMTEADLLRGLEGIGASPATPDAGRKEAGK